MTTILEKAISFIAPNRCICCSIEDNVICDDCLSGLSQPVALPCYECNKPAHGRMVCAVCAPNEPVSRVWVASYYQGYVAEAIKSLKFDRRAVAAQPLAVLLAATLPRLSADTVIVPIPTASSRMRTRGYDHCLLIAKALAQLTGLSCDTLLSRRHSQRQVGATRQQRIQQAQQAFMVRPSLKARGRSILVIDDVITTGATTVCAAQVLHQAGAVVVDVAAVAHQQLEP